MDEWAIRLGNVVENAEVPYCISCAGLAFSRRSSEFIENTGLASQYKKVGWNYTAMSALEGSL